jgi:hypothetical protein
MDLFEIAEEGELRRQDKPCRSISPRNRRKSYRKMRTMENPHPPKNYTQKSMLEVFKNIDSLAQSLFDEGENTSEELEHCSTKDEDQLPYINLFSPNVSVSSGRS